MDNGDCRERRFILYALTNRIFTASSRVFAQRLCGCLLVYLQAEPHVRLYNQLKFIFSHHTHSYDFIPWVEKHIQLSAVDLVYNSVRVLFLLVLAFALISVLRMRSEFLLSKIILFSIFAIRMVPSILMSMKFGTVADSAGPSVTQIVGDGLYLAVLTSDLIIAKIANRQVHALLPVIALASIISHHVSIVAAFIYHITILYDLCSYLQVFFFPLISNIPIVAHS